MLACCGRPWSTTAESIDPNSKSQRHMAKEEDQKFLEWYEALLDQAQKQKDGGDITDNPRKLN